MGLNREKVEHICERARRNLGQVEREVKPIFVLYRQGQYALALEEMWPRLKKLSGGHKVMLALKNLEEPVSCGFSGLIYHAASPLLRIFTPDQVFIPVLIPIDQMDNTAQVQHAIYHIFWHALNLLRDFREARKVLETPDYAYDKGLLKPKYLKFKETRHKLMADIFAAFMTEFEHKNGFLHELALIRARQVLEKRPGFLAEQYPYPLVAEACQLVFDDLTSAFQDLDQLFPVAFKMAEEVASTYGDEVIQQWQGACLPVQEMVWLGYGEDSILGNAVFTAEDPYVRTAAYLMCELLGHTPMPSTERGQYNPFAGGDKNRLLHFRTCEEEFQRVLSRAATMNDPSAFIEEMRRQNKQLAQGIPMGWCAHAIMEASKTFEQCLHKEDMTIEDVSVTFQAALQEINWDDILKVSRTVIAMHRAGKIFGLNELAAALSHNEGTEGIIRTLRISVKSDFFEVNVSHVQRHKTMQTPINIGFGPGKEAGTSNEEAA